MQILPQQIRNTERETVGELENPLYQAVRKNRLTASNCGTVIKRRSSTKPDNLVKTILGINYATKHMDIWLHLLMATVNTTIDDYLKEVSD
ncbi:hypothetical protein NQ317_006647 [Molorchus minor]|uniref:Uncharacterized protein n=1 Tax=Molorchus minor TaxID=1323400 RepID=A0ABQ9J7R5_9CUCU|nr:hypothetical protein NQ317_006647 [Molorchus minor]